MAERRALIAGSSGPTSVGVAIARELQRRGDAVFLTSSARRADAVRPLAAAEGWTWLELDSDDIGSMEAAVAAARPEVLVHALVGAPVEALARPLVELSRGDFEATLARCAWSLKELCRLALPTLAAGKGRVVALSSALAERAAPQYHAVGIGKATLEATIRYLAWELGPFGVQCNAVRFSLIPTEAAQGVVGSELARAVAARAAKKAPLGAPIDAAQIARTVAWLCAGDLDNLTGQIVTVDGGLSLAYG